MPTLSSRLTALHELHVQGLLTDEQFTRAKSLVLAGEDPPAPSSAATPAPPFPNPPIPPNRPRLNPVVPGVGLALGAAAIGAGGFGG